MRGTCRYPAAPRRGRSPGSARSRAGGPCPARTSTPALAAAIDLEEAEVVEHRRDAAAEDLQPLLRQPGYRRHPSRPGCRQRRRSGCARRSCRCTRSAAPAAEPRTRGADDGARAGQRGEQVDEVAALAEQPAAALLGIVEPVVVGERAGVDAHREHELVACSASSACSRSTSGAKRRLKPTISTESARQSAPRPRRSCSYVERERLLDEHRLAGSQRGRGERGVARVAGGDDDGADRRVVEDLVDRAGRPLEPEARRDVGGGQAALARDRDEGARPPVGARG